MYSITKKETFFATVFVLAVLLAFQSFAAPVTSFALTYSWSPNTYPITLNSPHHGADGDFGNSVASSGNIVVVGAPKHRHAYIFNATTGALVSSLVSPNPKLSEEFGWSVAVSGKIVVVGAPDSHVAYIFNTTSGAPIMTLTGPNSSQGDSEFGYSVATTGNIIVIGDYLGGSDLGGQAYIFNSSTGSLISTLNPISAYPRLFGFSVAASGNIVVVGDPGASAVYVFNATTGALISTLASPKVQADGFFGDSVAVNGSTAVVGDWGEKVDGYIGDGRAYIFNASTGALIHTLSSLVLQTNEEFGYSVAIGENLVAVGAPGDFSNNGSIFTFNATTGRLAGGAISPNSQGGGNFGLSVAMNGNILIVGAPGEAVNGDEYAGHAYIF